MQVVLLEIMLVVMVLCISYNPIPREILSLALCTVVRLWVTKPVLKMELFTCENVILPVKYLQIKMMGLLDPLQLMKRVKCIL